MRLFAQQKLNVYCPLRHRDPACRGAVQIAAEGTGTTMSMRRLASFSAAPQGRLPGSGADIAGPECKAPGVPRAAALVLGRELLARYRGRGGGAVVFALARR